jgi:hypothetical protein
VNIHYIPSTILKETEFVTDDHIHFHFSEFRNVMYMMFSELPEDDDRGVQGSGRAPQGQGHAVHEGEQ